MLDTEDQAQDDGGLDGAYVSPQIARLPPDVTSWLERYARPDELVATCLFADILPSGDFGETWTFLTNRRLFVLSPDGVEGEAELSFELDLGKIDRAEVREYVGSSGLIVHDSEQGHEVARFSLGSHREASDLCHCIKEVVREREAGTPVDKVPPPPVHRPQHRCGKCGRAVGRRAVCGHCLDRRQIMVRLLSHLRPYIGMAALGLVLTLTMTAMGLAPTYLTKVLIDDIFPTGNLGLLGKVIAILVGVHLGSAAISVFRSYAMVWLGNRVLLDLRVEVYEHLQMLHLSYYNQRQTGRIMSRVTGDLGRLQYFIAEGIQEILINLATMVLIASILAFMNWKLFVLALAPVPLIFLATWVFGHRMRRIYRRLWRRAAGLSAILADTIPGIRVVKSFAQGRREVKRFKTYSESVFKQEMQAARLSAGFFPLVGLMTSMGSLVVFTVGGLMVMQGETTVGVLVAFVAYMWRFYMPIQRFGRMNHRIQRCITSAERVFEIMDADPEPLDREGGIVLDPVKGRVEFRNVRFSYEPGKYALDDISFEVEPGEMIGLVGPSGAGKSTLVHMIARFYDVDEGEILIDGNDVQALDLHSFRRQIGVVLQDPYLFHGSVWANIAYANREAHPDEIIAAARAANAHGFIANLPDGYDTMIGERGQTLSGGERQRISIARAVLRDPQILILDEATASVDTETEVQIQTAIERLIENRTTFAIAHRLSTLRKANRLLVLERGTLAEMGTHEELMETGGLYSRLVNLQAKLSKMRAW